MSAGALAATVSSPFVLPLDRVEDEGEAGGKAMALARMVRLGVPVPPAFVVTDSSFQLFLREGRLRERITEICDGVLVSDPESVRRASGAVQDLLREARIPESVRRAVREGCSLLTPGKERIVRSSAVGEDSRRLSFAGLLDSIRDVRSDEGLERALLRCWSSCWSERALSYQLSRGARIERMGVVVQEQVQPEVAGVLFTVSPDPSIGAGEMIGEYCLGHGEELVSGRINPGRFTVSREGFRCRFLAEPEQPGGTRAPLRPGRDEIQSLQRIALLLEREFQGPQDIEWTMDARGGVQIVQSRPVTAPQPNARQIVWSNANINENYPEPVSPFLYSVAADGYYHYFRNLALAFGISRRRVQAMEDSLRGIVGVHGARLYYNLSNIHAALRMAPLGDHLVDSFNVFVGASERTARAPGAWSFRDRPWGALAQIPELARILVKTTWQFLFLERRVAAFERIADEYAARTHPDRLGRLSLPELHDALRSFLDIRCHRWVGASLADAGSMIGYGLLGRWVARAFPGEEHSARLNRLLQGLPDLVSAQPVQSLWKLSRRILADPALGELFAAAESAQIWEALDSQERFAGFRRELAAYLEAWGFRCSGELMLTVKSFQEDPKGVLSLLKGYASLQGESPVEALRRQEEDRRAETRRIRNALKERRLLRFLPWPHEGMGAALLIRWTQRAVGLRERARLKQSLLYSRCRRVLLRIGEDLASRGALQGAEDVFFLTHQEISTLVSGRAMFPEAGALVALRREEHARLGRMRLPDSFTLPEGTYGPACEEGKQGGAGDGDSMDGVGACGGRVTGRAAVLNDVSEAGRLAAGDVLVTRQTDPGWTPLFFVVGGLVMERGGMLSHGAILAREYGIPTVVGVREATRRISSGQRVLVDGDAGRVRLLD